MLLGWRTPDCLILNIPIMLFMLNVTIRNGVISGEINGESNISNGKIGLPDKHKQPPTNSELFRVDWGLSPCLGLIYFARLFFLLTVVAVATPPLTNSRASQSEILLLSPVCGEIGECSWLIKKQALNHRQKLPCYAVIKQQPPFQTFHRRWLLCFFEISNSATAKYVCSN